jgi:S1-C subfamily serine protease
MGTAVVGLIGAIIGSFSMMVFASTHFANVAGTGNTPPAVSAAPLEGVSDQARIVSAVKRVQPSVVAISVVINGQQVVPVDPFAQMFGGQSAGRIQNYHARASGSGFVLTRDGLIVTNAHVVPTGVTNIRVIFANGDNVPAKVYASNAAADIALLKVDGYKKLPPPIELGDSDRLEAGQWAIAIGEPLELKQTVTVGVVSGFNRNETIGEEGGGGERTFKGLLQTSAPINPGNSGGPLVDVDGRLIGVNQSVANPAAGAQGIGFAIPVNTMRAQVALLEKNPGVNNGSGNPYVGISMADLTDNVKSQINYQGTGVAVQGVFQGSPADQAGLQPGDVIQKIDGKDVTTGKQISDAIHAAKIGQTLNLQVWSQGFKKMVAVKVGDAPTDFPSQGQAPSQGQQP